MPSGFGSGTCLDQSSAARRRGSTLKPTRSKYCVTRSMSFPTKGNSLEGKLVPTDPLLYRFYEILCGYGKSLKDSIQEKCGDGIMSAIDFTLDVKKVEHPKGDRIVVTMDGKFLPYRRF